MKTKPKTTPMWSKKFVFGDTDSRINNEQLAIIRSGNGKMRPGDVLMMAECLRDAREAATEAREMVLRVKQAVAT